MASATTAGMAQSTLSAAWGRIVWTAAIEGMAGMAVAPTPRLRHHRQRHPHRHRHHLRHFHRHPPLPVGRSLQCSAWKLASVPLSTFSVGLPQTRSTVIRTRSALLRKRSVIGSRCAFRKESASARSPSITAMTESNMPRGCLRSASSPVVRQGTWVPLSLAEVSSLYRPRAAPSTPTVKASQLNGSLWCRLARSRATSR